MGTNVNIEDVLITPLSIIDTVGGDVLHAMKCTDNGYNGFGEAYFSIINKGMTKGWKRHREMVLNLVVAVGEVRFVIFDDRPESGSNGMFQEVVISQSTPLRLTVPKLLWLGFQGIGSDNVILNIANIVHDANEADLKKISEIDFKWNDR